MVTLGDGYLLQYFDTENDFNQAYGQSSAKILFSTVELGSRVEANCYTVPAKKGSKENKDNNNDWIVDIVVDEKEVLLRTKVDDCSTEQKVLESFKVLRAQADPPRPLPQITLRIRQMEGTTDPKTPKKVYKTYRLTGDYYMES